MFSAFAYVYVMDVFVIIKNYKAHDVIKTLSLLSRLKILTRDLIANW